MASKDFNGTLKTYPLAHLPTVALVIGTFSFWIELYLIRLPMGHSSWLTWGIFILCCLALLFSCDRNLDIKKILMAWGDEPLAMQVIWAMGLFLGFIYVAVGFYASFLPPHLVQETDALMYHIMLPRQHLLHHSFAHLPWSVPDLFLLPLDYALSPFELSTGLPNKWIQFIFMAACLGLVFQLVYILSGKSLPRCVIAVLALMACHAFAIQVGLAMLDLVMLYCFLALIHSLLLKNWGLAGLEFAFFCWSKSFIPPQMFVIAIVLGIVCWIASKKGFSLDELPMPQGREKKIFLTVFGMSSAVIALPHLIKAFYYVGTPLFPFGIGFWSPMVQYAPEHWHAILQRAADCVAEKDQYGHGRSIMAFIKHFWLIAVPERGVNNAFDYPVGLVYLLVLAPFVVHVIASLKSKKLPVLSLIVVIWWLTWWFGSQQSRFLLVPITLIIILTLSFLPKISRVFIFLIVVALGLETVSLINANRHDWGKSAIEVLREKDKQLLGMKFPAGASEIELNFSDVAFSSVPVAVRQNDSIYVVPQ